jgi:hypothetical protein
VPKGGIVCTVERVHDALAVRVLLVIVECRYEESGFVESNAEVRTTLFNRRGMGVLWTLACESRASTATSRHNHVHEL